MSKHIKIILLTLYFILLSASTFLITWYWGTSQLNLFWIIPTYIAVEMVISYMFNNKIRHIGIKDYSKAANFGFMATILHSTLSVMGIVLTEMVFGVGYETYHQIGMVLIGASSMAVGNWISTKYLIERFTK